MAVAESVKGREYYWKKKKYIVDVEDIIFIDLFWYWWTNPLQYSLFYAVRKFLQV